MALLGKAALAMWWDISPDVRSEFEDWHAHEHFPERLALPGFRRGTRWRSASGGGGMFVLYELEQHATLSSPEYVARLNAPTPWSTRLMPEHRNMVRAQCRVVQTQGGLVDLNALAHLLRHETPAMSAATEQAIRGHADQEAEWVFVACGYESAPLEALRGSELAADRLSASGARPDRVDSLYALACSALPSELARTERLGPP